VIVPKCERAESPEHVQDGAVVLIVVVHALGALHQHLIETEDLEISQLARVQVSLEQGTDALD
jgi:hypothetical protein